MIRIGRIEGDNLYHLFLENELISEAEVWEAQFSKGWFDLILPFNETSKKILDINLFILFERLNKITVSKIFDWLDSNYFESYLILEFYKTKLDKKKKSVSLEIIFEIQPKSADWNLPFSINSYTAKFLDIWEKKSKTYCDIKFRSEPYDVSIEISYSAENRKTTIFKETDKTGLEIKDCHFQTVDTLLNDSRGLLTFFHFPEDLKTPCEQYLLYFAQFLQDLGINATSNLKDEAGKVLFSVTPTDDTEALDKIREALAVYLNLPASPIVYDESFAAMRLQQQVENLQHSQKMAVREIRSAERELRLAQTVIEHQDKIIVQKDTIIEQQNKVIEKIQSKSIMMDSLENKEELEELYDGLKIGESKFLKEQLGIHLNPAKVIKTAVKNTFGKEDKGKSILGLDEE